MLIIVQTNFQTVLIEGNMKNFSHSEKVRQHYFCAEKLYIEKSELENYFNFSGLRGIASQKPFAKFFVYGTVINKYVNFNSIWIEITVKDENNRK